MAPAFTRRLATLLRTGMPLVPALSAMAEQLHTNPLGTIIEQVADDVNVGYRLFSFDELSSYLESKQGLLRV